MIQPIVVERLLNAPVAAVWHALTDRDKMEKWYFNLQDFKPEKGFQFEFTGGPPDGIQYRHLCEITEVIPETKLSHSWRYDGYPGISFVTWELAAQGDKTLLRLTHSGLETFPHDVHDFDRKNFEQGWDAIINTSLKNYLETA